MNITQFINDKQMEALNKLRMPSLKVVEDVTTDEHLGKMHFKQWERVEADITFALKENSQVYFELEAKVFRKPETEEVPF